MKKITLFATLASFFAAANASPLQITLEYPRRPPTCAAVELAAYPIFLTCTNGAFETSALATWSCLAAGESAARSSAIDCAGLLDGGVARLALGPDAVAEGSFAASVVKPVDGGGEAVVPFAVVGPRVFAPYAVVGEVDSSRALLRLNGDRLARYASTNDTLLLAWQAVGHSADSTVRFVDLPATDSTNLLCEAMAEDGWYGFAWGSTNSVTVQLAPHSPIAPRLNLWTGTSDRMDGSTLADVFLATNDSAIVQAAAQHNRFAEVESLGSVDSSRIRVVRYMIDGHPVYEGTNPRTVLDKTFSAAARTTLTEADFIDEDSFDIDWDHFYDEVVDNIAIGTMALEVTNITYIVVVGDGKASFSDEYDEEPVAALRHVIARKFGLTWRKPTAVGPLSQPAVYESRPVFKWNIGGDDSYTAFRVQVRVADTNAWTAADVVWDSGVRRAPGVDADGVYTFEPDVYAGDGRLQADVNYEWRVVMYNAKFSPKRTRGAAWSDNVQTFRISSRTP